MFAVAITDQQWFEFLRKNKPKDIINFWTPSPWGVKGLSCGDGFYFLLKSPIRKIAGGGCFYRYQEMTIEDAWKRYNVRNGCENLSWLKEKIKEYKRNTLLGSQLLNYKIGCIELSNCKFLRNSRFISTTNFNLEIPRTMQKMKYFDSFDPFVNYINEHAITE